MTMHPHRMPEQRKGQPQRQNDVSRSSSLSVSEWSTESSTSTRSKATDRDPSTMHYQQRSGASMELARHRSHHPPQHAETVRYRNGNIHSDNDGHYKLPIVHQPQQPPNNPLQPNHNHGRARLSPTVQNRSSPIVIIHNPEDGVSQAKLRWQHPMYDTSDDEEGGGMSVKSLSSPLDAPRNAPQSLPTALLRAPKLGSLPSQDYRLSHLATLPPPMSLSGDPDVEIDGTPHTTSITSAISVSQQAQNPRYLSSYGSLRESHLTGRFGADTAARVNVAASTGQLQIPQNNRTSKVHFHDSMEPPATLIPPPNPTLPQNNILKKKQPPAAPLSIRDRMMQKAQQQKGESPKDQEDKKVASSSLSAMFANDDNNQKYGNCDSNNREPTAENQAQIQSLGPPTSPARQLLPASMANAVAIAYNSNLNLFAMARGQRDEETRGGEQEAQRRRSSPMVLSSSMTGLSVLRAASQGGPAVRPTSLNILQAASRTTELAPPLATTNGAPTFLQLSRTMSEPSPHFGSYVSPSQEHTNLHNSVMSAAQGQHTSLLSPALGQETSAYYNMPRGGVILTSDGRTLIPPQSLRAPAMTSVSNHTAHAASHSQPTVSHNSDGMHWGVAAAATSTSGDPSYCARVTSMYDTASTQAEESNPDCQETFDMDLE